MRKQSVTADELAPDVRRGAIERLRAEIEANGDPSGYQSRTLADLERADREEYAAERLEYLRGELRAERISYGELLELQSLAAHIPTDDMELLEAAGVPEHPETEGHCPVCGVEVNLLGRSAWGELHPGRACRKTEEGR